MSARLALVFCILAAAASTTTGCGECSFAIGHQGRVVDADGFPVDGADVTTCASGNRCLHGDDDLACTSTSTDSAGNFEIDVRQCRPPGRGCALRPLLISAQRCERLVAQPPDHRGTFHQYVLSCAD